ncbi:MAG: phosphatidate cytidylyltransferase [Bacteroidota bacterium]|nr:phosphatidate cytidylyltransferase [Bacteroidota bacterium]
MKQGSARILTAIVGIPLVLAALWWGDWLFLGLIGMAALAAQVEFLQLSRHKGTDVTMWLPVLVGATLFTRFFVDAWMGIVLIGVAVMLLWGLRTSTEGALPRLSAHLASIIYPVGLLSLLVDIRFDAADILPGNESFVLVLMLFVLIWVTDSGAYYTGRTIGKRKFAPETSPNKTWEGTIGGLILAILTAALFKFAWLPGLSWLDVAVLSFIGGFWGQLGDLLESSLKRSAGVKDSGTLLPGHGGMLDRFDSLILAAPAYWAWLTYGSALL